MLTMLIHFASMVFSYPNKPRKELKVLFDLYLGSSLFGATIFKGHKIENLKSQILKPSHIQHLPKDCVS